jgi:hypothetical protein
MSGVTAAVCNTAMPAFCVQARAKQAAAAAAQQQQQQQQTPSLAAAAAPAAGAAAAAAAAAAGGGAVIATPGALQYEQQLKAKLDAAEAATAQLAADPAFKPARRKVEKQITMWVSQVSGTQAQVQDKSRQLVEVCARWAQARGLAAAQEARGRLACSMPLCVHTFSRATQGDSVLAHAQRCCRVTHHTPLPAHLVMHS